MADKVGEGGHAPGLGDAVVNVGVEIDTQFLGGLGQSVEGIPSFHTIGGAGTVTTQPLYSGSDCSKNTICSNFRFV